MSGLTTPTSTAAGGRARSAELLDAVDQRLHPAAGPRKHFNKVFPTHWSFMLGEIALCSFVVLLASGTYLAIFSDPSMAEVTCSGQFDNARETNWIIGVVLILLGIFEGFSGYSLPVRNAKLSSNEGTDDRTSS